MRGLGYRLAAGFLLCPDSPECPHISNQILGKFIVIQKEVAIDSEFQALIPPLTVEERNQLEVNLLAEGCRDALIAWAVPPSPSCPECGEDYRRAEDHQRQVVYGEFGEETNNHFDTFADLSIWECDCDLFDGSLVLLDGHNRYELCKKHGLHFDIKVVEFPDRQSAINWIINNQLGRRNLHPDQASYLRGKRYNGEKQAVGGQVPGTRVDQNDPPITTADRLASSSLILLFIHLQYFFTTAAGTSTFLLSAAH